MTDRCSDPVLCPNGNCPGCKNGQLWCQDPQCSPYCPSTTCIMTSSHDFNANMMILIIIVCLIVIFFIIWFSYGPQLFEHHDDHERANVIT